MRAIASVAVAVFFCLGALAAEPEHAMTMLQNESSLLDRLDKYVFESRKAEAAVSSAENALKQSDKRLAAAKLALDKARDDVEETRNRLGDTLRMAAVLNAFSSLPVQILSTGDPDQVRRGALIKRLAEKQARELARLSQASSTATVAEFIAGIEKANAAVLESVEKEAMTRLNTEIEGRRELLASMEKDRTLLKKRASELRNVEKEILKQIEGRLTSRAGPIDFEKKKGHFRMPLADAIVAVGFGDIVHPTFRTITPHPGLTLSHPGQPIRNVRAVAFGRVAWIGHMRGFGTTVVLDHASGWYTVYAGLYEVQVNNDSVVREGAVLGQVRRPPGDNDVKLYFELRHGGNALDPVPYFLKAGASR